QRKLVYQDIDARSSRNFNSFISRPLIVSFFKTAVSHRSSKFLKLKGFVSLTTARFHWWVVIMMG
ncbi:hypothetical protein, partial [Lentilactobacillus parafarraginis]|uniref:hypothetical protein n=1 Tax=Lentilactobacillus parafarraginis TaxID=390842 RepID=UPI001F31F858